MKIGLIDVDGHRWPNLCLMKISAYHKARGDTVEWHDGRKQYDLVYMSRVFTDSYSKDYTGNIRAGRIIKGGTGYRLDNCLQPGLPVVSAVYGNRLRIPDTGLSPWLRILHCRGKGRQENEGGCGFV